MRRLIRISILALAASCCALPARAGTPAADSQLAVEDAQLQLEDALLSIKALKGGDADQLAYSAALMAVRDAMACLENAHAILESQIGPPHYTIRALHKTWKPRYVMKNVPVRARMGGVAYVPKRVKNGGWLVIEVEIEAAHLSQPITAAELVVTIEGMKGWQYEHHWHGANAVKAGDKTKTKLSVFVAQEQMAGFWMRKAKVEDLSKQIEITLRKVVFKDGTRREYR